MPHAFDRRLAAGPLLCDGAMGTLLYARGVSLDACFDVLNVNQAKVVQSVHSEYIAAGADCIETNTFGANRFKLAVHGLASDVHQINLRGVKLARDVRSEEHTSELQSLTNLVCRLLLEKKKRNKTYNERCLQ